MTTTQKQMKIMVEKGYMDTILNGFIDHAFMFDSGNKSKFELKIKSKEFQKDVLKIIEIKNQ